MSEYCEGKTLNNVFIQFNGIIRDSKGLLLARLNRDISYEQLQEDKYHDNCISKEMSVKLINDAREEMRVKHKAEMVALCDEIKMLILHKISHRDGFNAVYDVALDEAIDEIKTAVEDEGFAEVIMEFYSK